MTARRSVTADPGTVGGSTFNLSSVDLNLLVALDALLEHRNVTHAGHKVGLSQPAMSRMLGRLRGVFNDDLLVRTSAGLTLTARGELLRAKLPGALGQIRDILMTRSFRPEEARSRITIAMPDHQTLVMLPRLLPRLRARAPNVEVVVQPLLAGSLKRLERGETHVAIGQVDNTPAGFFCRTLYTDRFVCLLRRDHPALQHSWTADRFSALRQAVIGPGAEQGFGQVYDILNNLKLPDQDPLIVPNMMAAPMMVAESDLVLAVPHRVAVKAASMLPLVVMEVPVDLPSYTVSIVWHERSHRDAEHSWLRGEIAAAAMDIVPPAITPN